MEKEKCISIIKHLILGIFVIFSNTLKDEQVLFAEKGKVDFSGYKNKKIKYQIKGEILFYWNQFLDPKKIVENGGQKVSLPHFWGKNGSEKIGSGTYVISFKNVPFENLGLIFALNSAYKAFVILDKKVFNEFSEAIEERKNKGLTSDTTFIGINSADIKNYSQINNMFEVTVDFVSEIISSVEDKDKKLISGDPKKVKKVYDTLKFSRDVKSLSPNWLLIDTQA